MRTKWLALMVVALVFVVPSFGGRYDVANTDEARHAEVKKKRGKEYYVNVRNMQLRDFLLFLSSLTSLKISLVDNVNVPVSWTGKATVDEILDAVLSPHGLWWEREGNKITVGKYVSRAWQIDIPSLAKKVDMKKSGKLTYTISYASSLSKGILQLLRPFLTDERSKISFDPMTGILTFYGTKREADAIESVINSMSLLKTVRLKLDIAVLQLKEGYETGIDMSLLTRAGIAKVGLNMVSETTSNIPMMSFITSSAEGFLKMLETYGKLKTIESREFLAVSGFPISYSTGGKMRYLKAVKIGYLTPTTGAGGQAVGTSIPTVDVQTDELKEGTDLLIIPRLLKSGDLFLDVSLATAKVRQIEQRTFEVISQKTTLEFPTMEYGDINLTSRLKPGEEMVMVSSVVDKNDINRAGLPFLIRIPVFKFLAGKHSKLSEKLQLIVRVRYEDSGDFGNVSGGSAWLTR